MRSIRLASVVVGQLLAMCAFAQSTSAELYPPGTAAPAPQGKATKAEKAEAKIVRKQAGTEAARNSMPGEGNPVPEAGSRVPKVERQTARSTRKAESARANKAGEITSHGETGLAK